MPFKKYVIANIKRILILLFITNLYSTNVIAVTYTYTPTSIVPASGALPDNACPGSGVTVTFNVTDDFTVNDVDLGINIEHTYRADLDMRLSSPATANIDLLTDVGGGSNNLNVLFDSDSANVVPSGDHALAPDFANVAQPENANALNNFDNENSVGNWVYFVCDDAGIDTGTLLAAELRFDGTPVVVVNEITGTIFRDLNYDGIQNGLELGEAGITVTAYDDTGFVVSAVTDANGNYVLSGLVAATHYRVEVSAPSYLYASTSIGVNHPLVSIVTAPTTHNVGIQNAAQYCQANPDFIMSRFTKEERAGANSAVNTILQYNYLNNGTDVPTNITNYGTIGSVYGISYLSKANVSYAATYFKRHSDIGFGGIGAIYKIDHNAAHAISTFATLPGTDPRGGAGAAYDWDIDTLGYAKVGKTGIGDIELSDDENTLFAVNMEDRKLYVLGVNDSGDLTTTTSYIIPNPCSNILDYRPMGLGFRDGKLYVGVTCTAESSVVIDDPDTSYNGPRKGNKALLSSHIYSFDANTNSFSAAPLLDIALDYSRGCGYDGDISNTAPPGSCTQITAQDGSSQPFIANWNPWQMDFDVVFNDKPPGNIGNQDTYVEYQQPILSDIEFDNDGSMIIQIKDINGDRTGHQNLSPADVGNIPAPDGQLHNGNSYGDILRACGNPTLGWTLESNGSCGGIVTGGTGTNEGPNGGEFYYFDNGPGGNGNINGSTAGHAETTMGGLLLVPGHADVITGVMDAHGTSGIDNGLIWLQNAGAQAGQISVDAAGTPKRLLVSYDANGAAFFGKASGIGDIEALCDPEPLELGDYVWNDADSDGIQDPSESGISGVVVQLYDGATLVGSATTDASGAYIFGGASDVNMSGANTLTATTTYQLRVDLANANLVGLTPTAKDVNANADDVRDNDGDNAILNAGFSTIAYTTGSAGQNNHTLDFGFTNVPIADLSLNKTVDNSTPNIGSSVVFSITVTNDGPSDATNVTVVDTVPSGFSSITNITTGGVAGGGTVVGDTITWSGLNIANGNSVVLTFSVTVNSTGIYNNLAEITASDQLDSDSTPNNGVDTDSDGNTNNDPGDEDDGDGEPVAPVVIAACSTGLNDIGGLVFLDLNENGVHDGAEIGFFSASLVVSAYNSANTLVATDNVNTDGSYVLNGIAGSSYRLELSGIPATHEFSAAGSDSQSGVRFVNGADCNVDFGVQDPTTATKTEVGNRIWSDTDSDGIQDADEPGLDGITVTLTCGADSISAVTANGGEYYFSNGATVNAGTTQALFMGNAESCTLSVNNNQIPLTSYILTTQNADGDTTNDSQTDVRDSDAQISGTDSVINFTVGALGENNHSYDFGFISTAPIIDYGDAPDTGVGTGVANYETTIADNGPSHVVINTLYLGSGVADGESDGQPNSVANGDDTTATADEDSPQTVLNFTSGSLPAVQVLATNQTGFSATLSGWIDYNGNGVFETATEGATATVNTGSNLVLVSLNFPVVPAGAPPVTFMRLRYSTDAAALNPTGAAANGEVEDHRVTINGDLSGSSELCYVVADAGDRLLTVNPVSGQTDDLAAGLGALPYTLVETIVWDLGDPLVSGDEVLYGANTNRLVQLLPTPRTEIGTFNNGIIDSDGFAIDWQSTPPVYYASGDAGGGHLRIFDFNPANANVLNLSPDITLPVTNSQIDDIAWDPLNRRLIAVTNNGAGNSHLVEFDLTNYPTSVTASDCGFIMFNGSILEDTEGLSFSRPGELYITTGDQGVDVNNRRSLFKVPVNNILDDCSTGTQDINAIRIGAINALETVPSGSTSGDHEAIACGISFSQSTASIGNRVWLDEDSDGDQDAGEDGIGGVSVYLCRSNASPCDASTAIRTEVSDANGGYLFTNIPVLDYIVAIDTSTVPTNLVSNPTYDEDNGTLNPNHQTIVSLTKIEEEYFTADFGYNWNNSPETETPPPGTVGSIGDRIWFDANGDGTQDSNEAGINAVTVNLFTDPDNDGIFSNLIATTTTDENGNYVFDGLPAGAYVVETNPLSLPAGVTWSQTGDPDEFAQVATNPDHRTTAPVILAPGDVYVNADFGYQGDVANTHTIGDTIYLDANSNGSQGAVEPGFANVTVSLLDASGNPLAYSVTDSAGQYLFPGLPDGVYSVIVTDTNNVLGGMQQSADPDVTLDNKSTLSLSGSDNLNQDFGYKPQGHTAGTGLIGDTIFLDIDGNGAQSAIEPGLERVRVELIASNGFTYAVTYTDENGNYQFGNLPDDTYTIRIDTSTLPNAGTGMTNTADPDGGTANESTGLVIAGGNIDLLQDFGYQVNTPNTIGGTLWNDNNADGTQGGGESLVFSSVTINLLDINGNVVGTTVTDASGHYQFSGLPDGTYTILVTDDKNVLAGHWLTDGTNPGNDLNSQIVGYSVSVVGGSNNQTGDFGYYVNLASIGNIVYRDDNNDGLRNPATEPGIPLVPVTLTITYPNNDTVTLTTLTDGAGFYSFEKLLADDSYQKAGDPGNGTEPSYSITVGAVATGFTSTYDGTPDASGFASGTNDNSDNTNGEIAYPVKGAAELTNDFGFVPGATIGNRIWLDLDNDGVQDANEDGIANRIVQLTPPATIDIGAGAGNPITTVTDTNGNYIFTELPLANGYVVTVTNPPASLNQTFDEDGTATAHTTVVNLIQANEEHLTADFGYSPSSGSIGDYIWSDANGDGQQDPNEIGLANVDVYLCNVNANPCDASTPAVNVIAMTTTDATGHYLFTGVNLADVYVIGIDATTLPAGYVQTGDPDGVGAPDNQTTVPALNTNNGINLDADFGYQPPAADHSAIGDTIYQDLDGNGAQGAGEFGIPGVTVQLFVDTTADGTPDTPIASEVTDSNGNYLFPSLPNGVAYSVVVTDTSNILNNYVQTGDPDAALDSQSTIPNLIMNRLDQDFGYRPLRKGNGIIGDRIIHDVNANGLQDAGDQGLEGVTVRIFDSNGNLVNAIITDENGQYLFTGLDPSGTYTVIVDTSTLPNGGAGWNNNIDPDGTNDSQTVVNLSLVPSAIDLDQDFGFIGAQSNTIEGTVWSDNDGNGLLTDGTGADPDETSNGLENVTIELKDSNGNIVATTTTDANGDYSFTGLPDGTYSVSVTDKHNELANLLHTDGPNAGDNTIDNNSQDDTGYAVSVSGGNTNSTADFGYKPVVTTPITLASFEASYNQNTGETTINWSTLTETGNIGFDLFLKIDGVWKQANDKLIVSKNMYSTELTKYQFVYATDYSTQWALVDVDIKGKRQSHGTYELNKSYGKENSLNSTTETKINWQHFNQLHNEKESLRNTEKSNAINAYIRDKIESAKQSTGEGS